MQTEVIKKAIQTSGKALELGVDAERMKQRLTHKLEDGMVEARRTLKRSRHAAEDLFDDTTYCVKQNPWQAVGVTLGLGFGIGALAGLLLGRRWGRACAQKTE